MKDIAKKFKEYIEINNLKPIDLATSMNISRSHLSRILNGERLMSERLRAKLNDKLNTNY